MRLHLIPRFAEILGLPARAAVQALRCRALTSGRRLCAVRREGERADSLQKPPEASSQGRLEAIRLLSDGRAAAEESTAADAAEQMPGKTVALAADAATPTDFPDGQKGTGRLPLLLRKLRRSGKPPGCSASLRSVKGTEVSRLGKCRDSTLQCPRPQRGKYRLRSGQCGREGRATESAGQHNRNFVV